jgi:NADPH:quinone reductase-like Zn-dependent oxidoreductase
MELEAPQAGPGQVRVRVHAAGVQPVDCALRAGTFPSGNPPGEPTIPGNELAGRVDQLGEGVTGFSVGDHVLGYRPLQAYAEHAVVPADQLVAKPAGMPWAVAGGFSAAAQTAHIALEVLAVGPGDTLLVHAAAGAVGSMAVQLAAHRGATVIGTAREANHDYLRQLGAVPVTYGPGLADRVRQAVPGGVDAALDGAGGDALQVSLELTPAPDRVLTLVEHAHAGELGVRTTPNLRSAARLAELVGRHTAGALAVHIRRTYPLAQAAEAHREVETRHGRGKVVLTVD